MVMMNLAMAFERTDEVILPAVYAFVAASFNASLTQIAYLTLARALAQAVFSPLGGFSGYYFNRAVVIGAGATVWGLTMVAFAFATSLGQGVALWSITGLGLAVIVPNVQSLTADLYSEGDRGKAFGTLHLTSALGASVGGLVATNLGAARPGGWEGWRLSILLLGALSFGIAAGTCVWARDPRARPGSIRVGPQLPVEQEDEGVAALATVALAAPGDGGVVDGNGNGSGGPLATPATAAPPPASTTNPPIDCGAFTRELGAVLRVPTFVLIVAQGIVGNVPAAALGFQTLYLQLLGISPAWASIAVSAGMAFHAAGGLLGGWIGDVAARASPRHGRIFACQVSVVLGLGATVLFLRGLPRADAAAHVGAYVSVLALAGLVNAWPAPACNNPIFAEIVPPGARTLIYSFDRSFEMAVAALAVPLVGVLAERWFGFDGTATASGDPALDGPKAEALSRALLLMTVIPWTACAVVYSAVHATYPRDKRRALAATAAARLSSADGPLGNEGDRGAVGGPWSGGGVPAGSSVIVARGGGVGGSGRSGGGV
jgi:MFS family permease